MMRKVMLLVMVSLFLMNSVALSAFAQNDGRDAAVALAASHDDLSQHLATYEAWYGEAYEDSGGWWWVDFYADEDGEDDEWLGNAYVNIDTGEIVNAFAPLALLPEDYELGYTIVEDLLSDDREVVAFLGDIEDWDVYIDYDRYDQVWYVYMSRGLAAYTARLYVDLDNESAYLESFKDANALDAQERRNLARNLALELVWQAEGIDQAIAGVDDWRTYVSRQDNGIYSVILATEARELFYALVDVERRTVIEARIVRQ